MPVIPNPATTQSFRTAAAFERWLKTNHASANEIWLKIHKKGSGLPTVTYAEALDVALCWGWIDGIRKSFDDTSFLQRFTPRTPRSIWSQVNTGHVARLVEEGRMQAPGLAQIEAAKADGRWSRAYAPGRDMEVPPDLVAAIKRNRRALETFKTLNRVNLFALAFRLGNIKTAATRTKRIATYVDMLAEGRTLLPNRARAVEKTATPKRGNDKRKPK